MVEKRFNKGQVVSEKTVVEDTLGIGNTAEVHRVRKGDEIVVYKIFPPVYKDVAKREADVLRSLRHPHIIPLREVGQIGESTYLEFPYAQKTLDGQLRDEKLPLDERVLVITDLAEALETMHTRHRLHGDVKPPNILFWQGILQLGDFGNTVKLDDSPRFNTNQEGVRIGTVAYAGPEIYDPDAHVSDKYDVYGAGAVAYEVLTGVKPFTNANILDMAMAHLQQPPASFERSLGASNMDVILGALEEPILEGLEKDPKRRPSAGDFGEKVRTIYERAKKEEAKKRIIIDIK